MVQQFFLDEITRRAHAAVHLAEPLALTDLLTPALVLNRPALQRNIVKMAAHVNQYGKGFRPHAKTHKCPLICHEQLNAGAVGVCVAKVSEAAALIAGGVSDILVTSPITTRSKARVMAQLARSTPGLMCVIDSMAGLDVLAQSLSAEGQMDVLIDIDVAMGRTGVRELEEILRLAAKIRSDSRLRFRGVQHYAGHLMHIQNFVERREKSLRLWAEVTATVDYLAAQGFASEIITGSGTGTYNIDVEVPAITDIQVGSYIFMDEEYRQVRTAEDTRFTDFEVALTVSCSTISQPKPNRLTLDGGTKAFASESVAPVSDELANVVFHFAGDEHGVLLLPKGEQSVALGQVLQFVTPHCDPTVNLHDYYWVQEADGLIHSCWPITARGCVW